MKYTINVHEGMPSEVIAFETVNGVRNATNTAREYTTQYPQPTYKVFVTWSRSSDGQRGYLNPDGNHEITGRAW